ncbi:hypothetical protein I4U23_031339 [Adineta vaga]|nr:hypothetical protein I4U23_031339 [Adineta vaga]
MGPAQFADRSFGRQLHFYVQPFPYQNRVDIGADATLSHILAQLVLQSYTMRVLLVPQLLYCVGTWIVLYRIIGNDLPPRHSSNQTLENLLFILQNEPSFERVAKIWILNRIVNKQVEQKLIDVLNTYKRPFIRIPFDLKEYRHISYYIPPQFPSDQFFHSKDFRQLSSLEKLRFIDTIYHKKNLYIMNANGARNFALRHGKLQTKAQWIMPFDSNCFLSQYSFNEIQIVLHASNPRTQYFIVPMIRLMNNEEVFHLNKSRKLEEPQIIFRYDSSIEFLDTIRYGRRSKEELLSYLGVRKFYWKYSSWEPQERKPLVTSKNSTEYLFQNVSFVLRLYSGVSPSQEQSVYTRACRRYQGILQFLDNIDLQVRGNHLLPVPVTDSDPCAFWSDQQLANIVKIARKGVYIES